jgi:hypothetical protein
MCLRERNYSMREESRDDGNLREPAALVVFPS